MTSSRTRSEIAEARRRIRDDLDGLLTDTISLCLLATLINNEKHDRHHDLTTPKVLEFQ